MAARRNQNGDGEEEPAEAQADQPRCAAPVDEAFRLPRDCLIMNKASRQPEHREEDDKRAHCRCTQRQPDQQPTVSPISSNGAVQKMPLASL